MSLELIQDEEVTAGYGYGLRKDYGGILTRDAYGFIRRIRQKGIVKYGNAEAQGTPNSPSQSPGITIKQANSMPV